MEFKISIVEDEKYLIIDVFEAITGEVETKMIQQTAKAMKDHHIKNVLADVRKVRNIANVPDKYDLAYSEAKRIGFPEDAQVAILVSPDDRSHDFIETVFRNVGYACRIFQDKNAATEWFHQ